MSFTLAVQALPTAARTSSALLQAKRFKTDETAKIVHSFSVSRMWFPGEEQTMRQWHGATDGWRETAEEKLPIGRLLETREVRK
ncbi:DUF6946 family protein [Mesorhizobium amorphae]|uniref:DUF6946 family protein n=1 Tax=Mesorhizobium amorphae TaxID=71433 RepID=UPI001784A4A0|nr:hypothetical protein [Mesorhizobium amorphae]